MTPPALVEVPVRKRVVHHHQILFLRVELLMRVNRVAVTVAKTMLVKKAVLFEVASRILDALATLQKGPVQVVMIGVKTTPKSVV
jgi:hypothetical protein